MTYPIRILLILTLVLTFAERLAAQATPTTTETTARTTTTGTSTTRTIDDDENAPTADGEEVTTTTDATDTTGTAATKDPAGDVSSYEIRNLFTSVLQRHPSELATILVLDPTLLSNEAFLSGYPELASFVAKHPEVRKNPRFYLAQFRMAGDATRVFDQILEMLTISATFIGIAFALGWILRQVIEQRRWNRLSKQQSEVHNKILDRFASSSEVLDYIKTPAGTKFLEAAPIPLHAPKAAPNTPATRIIWSVQLGVVAAIVGIGMVLLSTRFSAENAHGLFSMGVILFCIGGGFIASAGVSLVLSRRLGLWEPSQQGPVAGAERYDGPGILK
ncbi:MAG TPA: hypothetical protein VF618_02810 [Thermoanaerobaculia bacterium]